MSKIIAALKKEENSFVKRLKLIRFVFLIVSLLIVSKIFFLQIIDNEKPLKFSAAVSNPFTLTGDRGTIKDINGEILATSVEYPSIYLNPRAIKNKEFYVKQLSKVLKIPKEQIKKKLDSRKYLYGSRDWLALRRGKIINLNLKHVGIQMEPKRIYPSKHLAGQILGHTNIDQVGMEGIEYKYNKYLLGSKTIKVYKDGMGKIIAGSTSTSSINSGSDITLTINSKYQFVLEEEIEKTVKESGSLRGYGILMNPNTGEIYAMASYPFFDPNKYSEYSNIEKKNLPVWNMFEPGSIMKSFLVASALNEGVIDEETVIDCENGKRKIGGHTIKDVNPKGKLNPEDVLRYSSNIGASKIIEKLTAEKYYEYLKLFGFGKKTNIGLPGEGNGLLSKPNNWSRIKIANISFGQGMSVSAIQLAQALSIIANGGTFVEPYIIKKIENRNGKVVYDHKAEKNTRILKYQTTKKIRKCSEKLLKQDQLTELKLKELMYLEKLELPNLQKTGDIIKKDLLFHLLDLHQRRIHN